MLCWECIIEEIQDDDLVQNYQRDQHIKKEKEGEKVSLDLIYYESIMKKSQRCFTVVFYANFVYHCTFTEITFIFSILFIFINEKFLKIPE